MRNIGKSLRIISTIVLTSISLASCSFGGKAIDGEDPAADEESSEYSKPDKESLKDRSKEGKENSSINGDPASNEDSKAVEAELLQVNLKSEYAIDTNEDGMALAISAYPVIQFEGASKELDKAIIDYNEDRKRDCERETKEVADIKRGEEKADSNEFYKKDTIASVVRADKGIVSILENHTGYAGGAHSDFYYVTHNFDSSSGEELGIEDVVKDPSKLPELLYGIMKKNPEVMDGLIVDDVPEAIAISLGLKDDESGGFDSDSDSEDSGTDKNQATFTVGYDRLTFYFSPYELTAYAAGPVIISLEFKDYPDLVKKEYKSDLSSFIVPVDSNTNFEFDGKNLYWDFEEDEEDSYTGTVTLRYGEKVYESRVNGDYGRGYLVLDGDKKYFYVKMRDLSDYYTTQIFDLGSDSNGSSRLFPISFASDAPTDPRDMIFEGRVNSFDYVRYFAHYYLGEDGMPVIKDGYSNIEADIELTLKKDIEAMEVDERGGEVRKGLLKKGDKITFYRTDARNIIDFENEEGRLYRFEFSDMDYPPKANGEDIGELFDIIENSAND